METVACNLCGSKSQKILYKKPDIWTHITDFEFPVVKCAGCGLVFVNPRPDIYEMSNYYKEEYHSNRDTSEHRKRYEIQTQFLPALQNESVLDIGCAQGDFLLYLKEKYQNIKMFGCDLFSDSAKSKDINFKNTTLQEADYKESQFELVTAWAVFEHLHDPDTYFKKVSEILKPGGLFVFLVTNANSFYGRVAHKEDVPRHLYHFTKKTIKKYGMKYNLKTNKIKFDDRLYDGRGVGSFRHLFENISGVTWKTRKSLQYSFVQKIARKIGAFLDKIVFRFHWESKMGISGIMIVEMKKK